MNDLTLISVSAIEARIEDGYRVAWKYTGGREEGGKYGYLENFADKKVINAGKYLKD